MLELGAASATHHDQAVRRALAETAIDHVHVVGPELAAAVERVGAAHFVVHQSVSDCLTALRAEIRSGDLVLFKGSHGVGLERVVLPLLGR